MRSGASVPQFRSRDAVADVRDEATMRSLLADLPRLDVLVNTRDHSPRRRA
jgi:hypothetical protein